MVSEEFCTQLGQLSQPTAQHEDAAFDRAARAYDNQLPPDDGPEPGNCLSCEGTGKLSTCCGAFIKDDGSCFKCGSPAEPCACHTCKGSGKEQFVEPEPDAPEPDYADDRTLAREWAGMECKLRNNLKTLAEAI